LIAFEFKDLNAGYSGVTRGGGQGWTSASGRSTLGAPNWGRNVAY